MCEVLGEGNVKYNYFLFNYDDGKEFFSMIFLYKLVGREFVDYVGEIEDGVQLVELVVYQVIIFMDVENCLNIE